jgi:hypothetical protein
MAILEELLEEANEPAREESLGDTLAERRLLSRRPSS